MAFALALCSSLLWGSADFIGGRLCRRVAVYAVILVSQTTALAGMIALAIMQPEPWRPDALLWGFSAGGAGVVALGAFYRALAVGRMTLVGPISATAVCLPVLVGLALGQRPHPLQYAGIAATLVAMILALGPELRSGQPASSASSRSIALAGLSAVGFGIVLIAIALGSRSAIGPTLVAQRMTYVALVACILLTRHGGGFAAWTTRDWLAASATGAGDMTANLFYALAARWGSLPVVSLLASLYPVVTVLLAFGVDGERLRPIQLAGVLGTIMGIALIAAG